MELSTAFSLIIIPLAPPTPVIPRISPILSYLCPLPELQSAISWLGPLHHPFYSELRHLFFRRPDIKAWVRDSPLVFLSLPGCCIYDSPQRVSTFSKYICLPFRSLHSTGMESSLSYTCVMVSEVPGHQRRPVNICEMSGQRQGYASHCPDSHTLPCKSFSLSCLCFFSYVCWVLC